MQRLTQQLIKQNRNQKKRFAINVTGAQNLAEVCKIHDTILLHVSTDFVFDAKFVDGIAYYDRELRLPLKSEKGLTETDIPFPAGVYGLTKLTRRTSD